MALPTFQEMMALTNPTGISLGSTTTAGTTTQSAPTGVEGVDYVSGSGYTGTPSFGSYGSGDSTQDPYVSAQQAAAQEKASALAAYSTQANDLRSLLGRTETGLNQGLQQLGESYTSNRTARENEQRQAKQDYSDKRVSTERDKLGAYGTINKNANTGYRSLAQIIGRASGTGSSAFREALPDAVGRDMSGQRGEANSTYASNLGNIDTAEKKTDNSFASILQDLENQRRSQEQQLRTGVEQQRQSINSQLGSVEAQRVAAQGGNQAAIEAAGRPYQGAIDNSRNTVESFFNQFRPTLTAQQAPVAAADLSAYNVDRSNINAQRQGGDGSNPYADILRKKLQEGQA